MTHDMRKQGLYCGKPCWADPRPLLHLMTLGEITQPGERLTATDVRKFMDEFERKHFKRKPMPPSTVCDCAGTSMSLEEQLKQPWAKGVKPPVDVGDPKAYSPTLKYIEFEQGYTVVFRPSWLDHRVYRLSAAIGTYPSVQHAVAAVRDHSRDRCTQDLLDARTAWEAEEKRKKAPEMLSLTAIYHRKDGKYVLIPEKGGCYGGTSGDREPWKSCPHTFFTFAPKEIPLESVI